MTTKSRPPLAFNFLHFARMDAIVESEESSKYMIYTVNTNSIDSAINIADAYLNKNIDLSHCKILVISEDVAKEALRLAAQKLPVQAKFVRRETEVGGDKVEK